MENTDHQDDIRSALWHIASALKGIEQKLDRLETTSDMLVSLSNSLEAFTGPYLTQRDPNGKFDRHLDLLERHVKLLEEQDHIRKHIR
jgi:hypothetical protein|tara:strand:+ start:1302 stop:1565 length:264 start_codon:yes stop_codon:yes gene_type:complete